MPQRFRRVPKPRGGYTPRLWPVWLVGPLALVVVAGVAFGLYQGADALLTAHRTGRKPVDVQDVIKLTVTVLTLLGAVLAGLYAYRKQLLDEGASHLADAAHRAERYAQAAEQLGHEKAAVRLAGAYAMARLADDWPEQRQVCIDVLCAYLRMPYETDPAGPGFKEGEKEVRFSIIRSIRDRLLDPGAAGSWCGHDLDFTGAVFDGGDFGRATFSGGTVNFSDATFSGGDVRFSGATFSGGYVTFSGTTFSGGYVYFSGTTFSGSTVTFSGTTFSGSTVTFGSATFSGSTVDFSDATFSGSTVTFSAATFSGSTVDFNGATVSGGDADFSGATFSDGTVNFNGATVSDGDADFRYATFSGSTVYFSRATFSGGYVYFSGATVSDGTVDFSGTTFSGGTVTFGSATFSGGTVNFSGATVSGGTVHFGGATFSGGTVNFSGTTVRPAATVIWGPFPEISPTPE